VALKVKTIRVPLATSLADLATNTTLGTATRFDFAAVTVEMPETTRTIRYASVEVDARDHFTVATDFDGIRVGIKINAVAFSDTDTTIAPANTGDHTRLRFIQDVTSYFVTNDPGTATFTIQVGVAFQTSAASNVDGITACVDITYEYDDAASTHVKTVAIPLQSHHTTVGTTYVEVGTTAGTSNAPANQIPQLTGGGGILPESSVVIVDAWLEIHGVEIGTTDDVMTVRVDGATDNARYTCGQALASSVRYFDRISLTALGLSTNAAHAFEVKSNNAASFECVGAILYVTYKFDPASTTHLVSLQMPMDDGRSNMAIAATDSTSTDAERFQLVLDVQEPTTITMKQTGIMMVGLLNNITRNILASGQTARGYAIVSSATRDNGPNLIHRCDHSSSTWTLARGLNRLTLDAYSNNEGIASIAGTVAFVNYHCSKAATGCGSHARTTLWPLIPYANVAASVRTPVSPAAPNLPETLWRLLGAVVDANIWIGTVIQAWVMAERGSGEGAGAGWHKASLAAAALALELGNKRNFATVTDWFRPSSYSTDAERMALETARSWMLTSPSIIDGSAELRVTHHSIAFAVAGAVTVGGSPVANGKTVKIFALNADGTGELVASPTTTGGTGAFTANVPDSTRTYWASYVDGTDLGRSADGTPGTSTFNVTIGSGGTETDPPVQTVISPSAGTNFAADYEAAKVVPGVVDVIDAASAIAFLAVFVKFSDRTAAELVYAGTGSSAGFVSPYISFSTITGNGSAGVGYRLSVRRDDNWPKPTKGDPIAATFFYKAVDAKGNVLS